MTCKIAHAIATGEDGDIPDIVAMNPKERADFLAHFYSCKECQCAVFHGQSADIMSGKLTFEPKTAEERDQAIKEMPWFLQEMMMQDQHDPEFQKALDAINKKEAMKKKDNRHSWSSAEGSQAIKDLISSTINLVACAILVREYRNGIARPSPQRLAEIAIEAKETCKDLMSSYVDLEDNKTHIVQVIENALRSLCSKVTDILDEE